ncbi:uncharacterized protein PV07_08638 [Cladophialophora immunda]|uniref:Uncharacterized protein n=1 Tax=Cladophialophora immunda TaxID=569365 RepID=A0A0D2AKI5_9EURO|nr:uncharacterized protein PV07_08638 [Cladophialophora immunda]KIW25472.1 hypothetical protein PV07_08638 [Cladophialophora immunda]
MDPSGPLRRDEGVQDGHGALAGSAHASVSLAGQNDPATTPGDPPTVSSILHAIEAADAHGCDGCATWTEYQLEEKDWFILRQRLDESGRKIRYHYFSETQTFAHQMVSYAHESSHGRLTMSLAVKLAALCASEEEKAFEKMIVNFGQADAKSSSNSSIHRPDGYFAHGKSHKYGVVVEIAYSQKRERLQDLAEFYILRSDRKIQMLLAIDYDYGRTMKVSLITWRPNGSGGLDRRVQVCFYLDAALDDGH